MENGWNSLHSAAETGHLSIIRALVQYGGDIFKQDRYGDTPRKLAQIHGNSECVKYLYGENLGGGAVINGGHIM